MNRRQFLLSAGAAGCVFAPPFERAAAAARKKVKITDAVCAPGFQSHSTVSVPAPVNRDARDPSIR